MTDIRRSNYFKVNRKGQASWDMRDVVEHFNPHETFEEVKARLVSKREIKPIMVQRKGK